MTRHAKDLGDRVFHTLRVYLVLIVVFEVSFLFSGGLYRLYGTTPALDAIAFALLASLMLIYWYRSALRRRFSIKPSHPARKRDGGGGLGVGDTLFAIVSASRQIIKLIQSTIHSLLQ
jgi:membrane protein implicated in regulation of membrane protease activity